MSAIPVRLRGPRPLCAIPLMRRPPNDLADEHDGDLVAGLRLPSPSGSTASPSAPAIAGELVRALAAGRPDVEAGVVAVADTDPGEVRLAVGVPAAAARRRRPARSSRSRAPSP